MNQRLSLALAAVLALGLFTDSALAQRAGGRVGGARPGAAAQGTPVPRSIALLRSMLPYRQPGPSHPRRQGRRPPHVRLLGRSRDPLQGPYPLRVAAIGRVWAAVELTHPTWATVPASVAAVSTRRTWATGPALAAAVSTRRTLATVPASAAVALTRRTLATVRALAAAGSTRRTLATVPASVAAVSTNRTLATVRALEITLGTTSLTVLALGIIRETPSSTGPTIALTSGSIGQAVMSIPETMSRLIVSTTISIM